MATRTVGNGQTFATIAAGIAAAAADDVVEIHEEDAFGGRDYSHEDQIIVQKKITLRSDTKGQRNFVASMTHNSNLDVTIQDFHFVGNIRTGNENSISINSNGTTLVERCIFSGNPFDCVIVSGSNYTCTFNNCILIGARNRGFRIFSTTGGVCTLNYCVAAFVGGAGFFRDNNASAIANNCLAYACDADFSGTWSGSGTNNASTEASGVPGSNPVHSITKAKAGFAYHNSPPATNLFPFDFRSIEAQMAAGGLKDAGSPIVGVTEDIDGRTRSTTAPNIGATEGFTGLGVPKITLPVSVTVGVQDEPSSSVKVKFQ